MSLLTTIFSFLGIAVYNTTPPTVANAQATTLQCDQSGNLLITIAGFASGAPILAQPVATASLTIQLPGIANGFQVSQPFNSSGGAFVLTMPTSPVRGMRVTVMDSGGFAATHPVTVTDANGFVLQNPFNPGATSASLSFSFSGYAATWEFITGDPTNGSFWMVVRTLQ